MTQPSPKSPRIFDPNRTFYSVSGAGLKYALINLVGIIPLIGGTVETCTRDWREASRQFSFTWFISIIPTLAVWLVKSLSIHGLASPKVATIAVVNPGEILVSSMALLAPAAWVIYEYNRRRVPFRNHLSFQLSIIVVCVGATVLFVMDKVSTLLDDKQSFTLGTDLYLLSLSLCFLSILYTNRFIRPPDDYQDRDERNMVNNTANFDPANP